MVVCRYMKPQGLDSRFARVHFQIPWPQTVYPHGVDSQVVAPERVRVQIQNPWPERVDPQSVDPQSVDPQSAGERSVG